MKRERPPPKTKWVVERRRPRLRRLLWHRHSCLCEPKLVWHSRSRLCFRSCFFSVLRHFRIQVAFSDLPCRSTSLAWGSWIPSPLPLVPISKGLRRFLPMYPHALMLQTKALTWIPPHFIPILYALKHKTQRFPVADTFKSSLIAQTPCIPSH